MRVVVVKARTSPAGSADRERCSRLVAVPDCPPGRSTMAGRTGGYIAGCGAIGTQSVCRRRSGWRRRWPPRWRPGRSVGRDRSGPVVGRDLDDLTLDPAQQIGQRLRRADRGGRRRLPAADRRRPGSPSAAVPGRRPAPAPRTRRRPRWPRARRSGRRRCRRPSRRPPGAVGGTGTIGKGPSAAGVTSAATRPPAEPTTMACRSAADSAVALVSVDPSSVAAAARARPPGPARRRRHARRPDRGRQRGRDHRRQVGQAPQRRAARRDRRVERRPCRRRSNRRPRAPAKPWSSSSATRRLRWSAVSPPKTTAISRRLPRTAEAARLKPEARM